MINSKDTKRIVSENIKYDEWLSGIIGKESYSIDINQEFINNASKADSKEHALMDSVKRTQVFLFTKISPDAVTTIEFAEKNGFRLIDTNLSLRKDIGLTGSVKPKTGEHLIRFADEKDKQETVDLARRNFKFSRFHLDDRFPKELANEIRAKWAENFFNGGRGDKMAVCTVRNKIAGFLLLLKKEDNFIIDLIAVEKAYRKMGIARDLINFAYTHYKNLKYAVVGTQIANIPAVKLYQKMGFSINSAKYIFHFHGGELLK